MAVNILKAKFWLIAPLRITDYVAFKGGLQNYEPKKDASEYSIKEQMVDFLGMGKRAKEEALIEPGEKLVLQLQSSGKKDLNIYNNKPISFLFKKEKNEKEYQKNDLIKVHLNLRQNIELYIAPNKKCALAVLCLEDSRNGSNTIKLQEVIETNYSIHKTDSKQTPTIGVEVKTSKETTEIRSSTLPEILKNALPDEGYLLDNISRFTTATYIQVDSSSLDETELKEGLVRLGLSKGKGYDISKGLTNDIVRLFNNVWLYNSSESFAYVAIVDERDNFLQQNDLEKSYIYSYIATLLVEQTYTSVLRHLDEVAVDAKELDRLYEAQLVTTLAASQYDHLNRLMKKLVSVRDFEAKHQAIESFILSRRAQINRQMLEIEKANQQQKIEETEKAEKRIRAIGQLIGFIGVGQVVFAILQLFGAERIFGADFASSRTLNIISVLVIIVFSILIVILIVKIFRKKKQHSK